MKPYTSDEVNAAIARVETAKQNHPRGWVYLEELNLGNADAFVMYAFRNADLHMKRLEGEDRRLIYATGWLQGLSIGVALAEERAEAVRTALTTIRDRMKGWSEGSIAEIGPQEVFELADEALA